LTGLIFFGCKSHSGLTKERYTDIILDLQVAETVVLGSTVTNKDSLRNLMHKRICDIYGFKSVRDMKSSLEPLTSDPELMLEITKAISHKLDALADTAITSK
jgi:hypothetical protein